MIANDAPTEAIVPQIINLVILTLVLFGWVLPFACFGFLGRYLHRLLASGRNPDSGAAPAIEAATAGLGTLILMLVSSWAYLGFGLCRLGGNPPLWALWLTLALLWGGCGLLFQQRWAAVVICGAGWWVLWRLWSARGLYTAEPTAWQVAFWLASLALPLTAATVGFWPRLRGGWQLKW